MRILRAISTLSLQLELRLEKTDHGPKKTDKKPSDPAACIQQPIPVCKGAAVPDRLVVSTALVMPLLLLISVVLILGGLRPTVWMRWSLEADPDESVGSLWPVACFIDGGIRPKVLVVAQDARLADLLNVKGKIFAPRQVIAAGSKLSWGAPHSPGISIRWQWGGECKREIGTELVEALLQEDSGPGRSAAEVADGDQR